MLKHTRKSSKAQDPGLDKICSIIYNIEPANSHASATLPTPPPHRREWVKKNPKCVLKKADKGPQIPDTEILTPLPIQEPQDPFDFSDPTNDLLLRMHR